ncbi:hypothetical protein AA313_de0207232 [Arthrobotrys entomopaga]|nr:hypothetical protein AA313_de0207232 [Arthrobotrys entomopaga]
MGLEKPDASVVSTSSVGGDKSMLSLQTKSSYSIPEDGRAITIETNKKSHQKQPSADAASAVSQGSQTSLLIEYFEGARGQGSAPSHRPSVRVKVTPSSRRAHQQAARTVELGSDGRPINKRQPSYTQRISLSSPRPDDRLAVREARRKRRSEAGLSDFQAPTDDFTSEVSEQSQSLVNQPPMKVEVIREGPGSPLTSPKYYRTNSGGIRGRGMRKAAGDDDGDSSLHPLSQRRSQSLTNEREAILGEGSKLTRKRSQSMDRELTKEERREQRRLEKKMAELNGEPSVRKNRRGRSVSREGAKRKQSSSRNVSGTSDLAQNPLLLEAVEDAIKRLILPQFEALKASNQAGNTSAIDEAASAAIAAEAARAFAERRSQSDLTTTEAPMLVLHPDTDRGTGHGLVLSQSDNSALLRSESVRSRGPGFGPGPAPGSDLALDAPPVEPLDALFPRQAAPHERIRMPSIPSMASSDRGEHELLYDEHEGAPYPNTAAESGMPMTGNTPPPTIPEAVAPLNISRRGTPASKEAPTPKRSFASLRRQFDAEGMIRFAPLAAPKHAAPKSDVSVATASTAPSWHPNKSSRWNQDTVGARDLGIQSRSDLNNISEPRDDAMNWWFEGNKSTPGRADTEIDQSMVGHSVVDESVVDQSAVGYSVGDPSVVGHSVVDQSLVGGQSAVDDSVVDDDHSYYKHHYEADSDIGLTVPNDRAQSALSVPSSRGNGSSMTEVHKIQLDPPDTASNPEEDFEARSQNRDSVPGSFEARHTERLATGQNVREVGAYASMRSTPVDLPSQRASVYDNLSSVHSVHSVQDHDHSVHDQYSQASLRPQDRATSPASTVHSEAPRMTFNAAPVFGYDEPAIGHYRSHSELGPSEAGDDEDDVVTNPYGADRTSREVAMDDAITNPYTDNRLSRDMSVLSGVDDEGMDDMTTNPYGADRTSREIAMEGGDQHWGYAEDDHDPAHNANFGLRAMQAGQSGRDFTGDQESMIDREAMLTPLPIREEYHPARPLSPLTDDGIHSGLKGITSFGGGGHDDYISEDGDDFIPFRGHVRSGSGNSHGMPSPLYDSAMGHGIDRIQSKDIVALMDHLTVRDAARNARDTEILMTLVRSAAEMRDSFDDLKKQLAAHSNQMVLEIDQGAEKTVAKLGAPRPIIPLPVSRQIKAPRNFDEEKEEAHKKTNVFRRALKGLSMKSSNDLARIEDMLVQLLGEVEGLKAASYAYTESNTASHAGDHVHSQTHTQSIHSQHSQQSYAGNSTNNLPSVDYSGAAGIGQRIMNSNGELNYYGVGNPALQQSNHNVNRDVAANDDGMRTPRGYRDVQPNLTPLQSIPTIQTIQTPSDALSHPVPQNNTPQAFEPSPVVDKGKKRESSGKPSRWSETTASSGFKSLFARKKKHMEGEPSRTNSEFEEDWVNSPQPGATDTSPYSHRSQQLTSPIFEKPSLEANRRSLEIKHPQPRINKNHHHNLEQAAESHVDTQSPALTQSTTSLNRFIQHGGSYNNITNLAPMFPDADQAPSQNAYQPASHYSSQNSLNNGFSTQPQETHDDATASPIPPPTATTEDPTELSYANERKKKHRHKRNETLEEKAARRERRRQRHGSREALGEAPQEADEDYGSRPASAASRKYTRPLSAASHRSYRVNDDGGTPTPNRQRTSHLTHITTDTFGYQD